MLKRIMSFFNRVVPSDRVAPSHIDVDAIARCIQIIEDFENKQVTPSAFPHIEKQKVVSDLKMRVKSGGEEIYQDENTCGLAAICHIFAKVDPLGYVQFTLDLYQFGAAKHRHYEIKASEGVGNWAKTVMPTSSFDGADFVLLGSLRFVENIPNRFKITGAWDGLTWPWEVIRIGQSLAGLKHLHTPFWNNTKTASSVEPLLESGEAHLVMLTTGRFAGGSYVGPWHYQLYRGKSTQENGQFEFNYWDYGRETRQKKVTVKNFNRQVILIMFKKNPR